MYPNFYHHSKYSSFPRGFYYVPPLNPYRLYNPAFFRPFPAVDPSIFMNSAKDMEVLMKSASQLLEKMASSRKFSFELMSAAQESKIDKVKDMIKSTGIQKIPKVSYTPSGLSLNFSSDQNNTALNLKLRWM